MGSAQGRRLSLRSSPSGACRELPGHRLGAGHQQGWAHGRAVVIAAGGGRTRGRETGCQRRKAPPTVVVVGDARPRSDGDARGHRCGQCGHRGAVRGPVRLPDGGNPACVDPDPVPGAGDHRSPGSVDRAGPRCADPGDIRRPVGVAVCSDPVRRMPGGAGHRVRRPGRTWSVCPAVCRSGSRLLLWCC
jgi:hypothetical protein